jgi:hypothetical protein
MKLRKGIGSMYRKCAILEVMNRRTSVMRQHWSQDLKEMRQQEQLIQDWSSKYADTDREPKGAGMAGVRKRGREVPCRDSRMW